MLRPIIAASMGIVPDPQQGSAKVEPARQWLKYTIAAARVSRSGAGADTSR